MQEKFEHAKQEILNILKTAAGELLDIAYYIYELIASVPGKEPQLLRFVFEESEQIESSEEQHLQKVFTEEEKYSYKNTYGKIVDGTLEVLLKKGLSKEQFYEELWKGIDANPLLENTKEKAFVFFYIWIDDKVPYFELEPGMRMSNDDYAKITEDIFEKIIKARFILSVPTEQKTECASRLVQMLGELKNEREKTVLMAQILDLNDQVHVLSRLIKNKVLSDESKETD